MADVAARNGNGASLVPVDENYTYAKMTAVIDDLLARYPYLEVGTIGQSVMGKDILYLKLGKGSGGCATMPLFTRTRALRHRFC